MISRFAVVLWLSSMATVTVSGFTNTPPPLLSISSNAPASRPSTCSALAIQQYRDGDFRDRLREERLEISGLKRRSEDERFEILREARKNSHSTAKILWRNRPLGRLHEVLLFLMYGGSAVALTRYVPMQFSRVILLSVWLSFSLATSFTEAWVKFRAPLLRPHIAVDVGRHVFAASHAVQLGIVSALWYESRKALLAHIKSHGWLAAATVAQFLLSFGMGPLLYARAQDKMLREAGDKYYLTTEEQGALKKVAANTKGLNIPGKRWHRFYALTELLLVVALGLSLKSFVLTAPN